MPWNSDSFISSVGNWLASNDSAGDDKTAMEIANYYSRSAVSVIPLSPQWASNPLSLKPDTIIFGGFSSSFKLARLLTLGKPTPDIWLPAATSIVSYWSGVNFSPMPPPPGGLTGATNVITSPGSPTPLNSDITQAFQEGDPYGVAEKLNDAILKHLSTVTGLWTGTAPGTPPPPFSLAWTGIE